MVEGAISHLRDRITRIEVHLSDENSDKGGDKDKRCMLEARLSGLQPIAVTHQAETVALAIDGAAEKLERAIGSALGKLNS
jgi:ribosome-associated translation inhibitor RaiA